MTRLIAFLNLLAFTCVAQMPPGLGILPTINNGFGAPAGGGGGGGSKALVFHTITTSSSTTAQNTVGSTIIVIHEVNNASAPTIPSDTAGNTWTPIAWATNLSQTMYDYTYIAYGPTTSGSDTFTGGNAQVLAVSGWSGTQSTSAALDGSTTNINNIFVTSLQCGSLTPSGSSDVFIASVMNQNSGTFTFTNTYSQLDTNLTFPYWGSWYQLSTSNSAANPVGNVSGGGSDLLGSHACLK